MPIVTELTENIRNRINPATNIILSVKVINIRAIRLKQNVFQPVNFKTKRTAP